LLNDLVGAVCQIKLLVFTVVSSHDAAIAKNEGGVAVGSRLRTGDVFEPRGDRLEGVEFDEGILLPFTTDERGKLVRFLVDKCIEVIFNSFSGSI